MSTRFYYGQEDYIVQLNAMDDVLQASPYMGLPISGGTMTGALISAAGSAAAPSIGVGANNSGLYKAGTNQIGMSINGANVATWTSSGLTLAIDLAITEGGTGASTAAGARTNLGLDAIYAPIASPTFTGTVSGITKSMVGLGNVDNTSDVNKPISTATGLALGLRNRIDNSNFSINQRGVSGTVTLAAGAYGHDRWKAGSSGCTYTFSTSSGITTLTITAGTLVQVIEGNASLQGSLNYTTSWTGTSTGRFGSASFAASGFTTTLTGGTNQTLEFGTGTLSHVQVEPGLVATPYEVRNICDELARCRNYYVSRVYPANAIIGNGQAFSTSSAYLQIPVTEALRSTPTVSLSGNLYRLGGEVISAPSNISYSAGGVSFSFGPSSSFVAGDAVILTSGSASSFTVTLSADL